MAEWASPCRGSRLASRCRCCSVRPTRRSSRAAESRLHRRRMNSRSRILSSHVACIALRLHPVSDVCEAMSCRAVHEVPTNWTSLGLVSSLYVHVHASKHVACERRSRASVPQSAPHVSPCRLAASMAHDDRVMCAGNRLVVAGGTSCALCHDVDDPCTACDVVGGSCDCYPAT